MARSDYESDSEAVRRFSAGVHRQRHARLRGRYDYAVSICVSGGPREGDSPST